MINILIFVLDLHWSQLLINRTPPPKNQAAVNTFFLHRAKSVSNFMIINKMSTSTFYNLQLFHVFIMYVHVCNICVCLDHLLHINLRRNLIQWFLDLWMIHVYFSYFVISCLKCFWVWSALCWGSIRLYNIILFSLFRFLNPEMMGNLFSALIGKSWF